MLALNHSPPPAASGDNEHPNSHTAAIIGVLDAGRGGGGGALPIFSEMVKVGQFLLESRAIGLGLLVSNG